MNEVDNNLSTILETEFVPSVVQEEVITGELVHVEENLPAVVENQHAQDIAYDYELSRTTHRDLLEQGQESLTELLKVAKESQHPRAYEVAANMLNTLSNMTDKLMGLHEKRKALDGTKGQQQQTLNVDKAVFVGSTADLLKQIKEKQ
jgi:hypothetical protein